MQNEQENHLLSDEGEPINQLENNSMSENVVYLTDVHETIQISGEGDLLSGVEFRIGGRVFGINETIYISQPVLFHKVDTPP
jgi:hypothetical protein